MINFALANGKVPDIIWCSSAVGLTTKQKVDVFCAAVRYRAIVFAAPLCFVSGLCPAKCGEPFLLWRWILPAPRCQPIPASFEGVFRLSREGARNIQQEETQE